MANTPNFSLYKPSRADNNVEVDVSLADNFTKIDTELQNNKGGLAAHISNPNAHTSENVSHADGSVKTMLDNHESRITQTTENINTLVLPSITAVGDRVTEIENLGIDKLAPDLEGRIQTIESDVEGILAPATFEAIQNQSYTFDEYRIGYVDSKLSDLSVNLKTFSNLKTGTDWSPAFDAAIAKAKSLGVKLRIPAGTYYISKPIDISGLALEGDETSVFNVASMGTWIICLTKDFSALKQISNSTANLTFSVKNIIVKDADIGLETGYSVNSSFENLYLNSCNLGIKHGNSAVIGSLFNTFHNIYTKDCLKGIDINGSQWANNNVFVNCFFGGTTYGATIDCNGGIGAVNNTFIACEFQSDEGFGIKLGVSRGTNLDSCYYEAKAAAVVWDRYQEGTIIRGGTFGSLQNDNSLGHSAFIVASATAGGYLFIDSPYVYLPAKTVNSVEVTANLNFIDTTAIAGLYNNVRFGHSPRLEGTPTNFKIMKSVDNFYTKRGTSYNFTPIATSSTVPNNSFWVDSSTNTLKYKDNAGVSKTVTLT